MPSGSAITTGFPAGLRWEDILPALARAEDRLARLDETLKSSPIRDGFLARTHYLDALASLALEGELIHMEDLVLADADMAVRTPTHELVRAQTYLTARRQIADTDAGWIFTGASARQLRHLVQGTGERESSNAPADGEGGKVSARTAARHDSADDYDDDLSHAFAALDSALANISATLAGPSAHDRREADPEEEKFEHWRESLRETQNLPPTLAAARALVDWDTQQPLAQRPWLGRLIAAALLRQRGKAQHLPGLSIGLRAVPPRLRHLSASASPTQRLVTQLDAIAAAGDLGLTDHARWLSARAGLLRRIAGRRSSSRLPDLIELVMRRPLVSAAMVAEELDVSSRATLDLITALGLRETTGRGRYRAWGVL